MVKVFAKVRYGRGLFKSLRSRQDPGNRAMREGFGKDRRIPTCRAEREEQEQITINSKRGYK